MLIVKKSLNRLFNLEFANSRIDLFLSFAAILKCSILAFGCFNAANLTSVCLLDNAVFKLC